MAQAAAPGRGLSLLPRPTYYPPGTKNPTRLVSMVREPFNNKKIV